MNARLKHFRKSKAVDYNAGDTIYLADTHDNKLYAVQSGKVDIYFNHKLIEIVGADNIFGEIAFIGRHPHITTAIARTDCKIVFIHRYNWLFLLHEAPTFASEVMDILVTRQHNMMKKAF